MTDRDEMLCVSLANMMAGCAETASDKEYLSGFALHCVRIAFAVRFLCKGKVGSPPGSVDDLRELNLIAHSTITSTYITGVQQGRGLEKEFEWVRACSVDVVALGMPEVLPAPPAAQDTAALLAAVTETLAETKKNREIVTQVLDRVTLGVEINLEEMKGQLQKMQDFLRSDWGSDHISEIDAVSWMSVLRGLGEQCGHTRNNLHELNLISTALTTRTALLAVGGCDVYFDLDLEDDAGGVFAGLASSMLGGLNCSQMSGVLRVCASVLCKTPEVVNLKGIDVVFMSDGPSGLIDWFVTKSPSEHPLHFVIKGYHASVCVLVSYQCVQDWLSPAEKSICHITMNDILWSHNDVDVVEWLRHDDAVTTVTALSEVALIKFSFVLRFLISSVMCFRVQFAHEFKIGTVNFDGSLKFRACLENVLWKIVSGENDLKKQYEENAGDEETGEALQTRVNVTLDSVFMAAV